METRGDQTAPGSVLDEIREHGDRAAEFGRAFAPLAVRRAEQLYAAYRLAAANPERFASGKSLNRGELRDIVERSIRAEFAVALGVSETAASHELEHAQLLIEDLPRTRALLERAEILWESGQAVCRVAGDLPATARPIFDQRAAALAQEMTPTQLRKALRRLREELHDVPLIERHLRAKERRSLWVSPEADGMATLSAHLPAHLAMGAFNRIDSIARSLHSLDDETRTLAQIRADAAADILTDGDIAGTTPLDDDDTPAPTFVPGVRAHVRITVPVLTAAAKDDTAGELDGYGPIPADIARELVGTSSSFYRVLTDPITCQVTSVGQAMRTPPTIMRLTIQLRDQTCRFAGCTRTAIRSEIDHATEWRNGGHTALDNLLTLRLSHESIRQYGVICEYAG